MLFIKTDLFKSFYYKLFLYVFRNILIGFTQVAALFHNITSVPSFYKRKIYILSTLYLIMVFYMGWVGDVKTSRTIRKRKILKYCCVGNTSLCWSGDIQSLMINKIEETNGAIS